MFASIACSEARSLARSKNRPVNPLHCSYRNVVPLVRGVGFATAWLKNGLNSLNSSPSSKLRTPTAVLDVNHRFGLSELHQMDILQELSLPPCPLYCTSYGIPVRTGDMQLIWSRDIRYWRYRYNAVPRTDTFNADGDRQVQISFAVGVTITPSDR